jgi:hypothetical protein
VHELLYSTRKVRSVLWCLFCALFWRTGWAEKNITLSKWYRKQIRRTQNFTPTPVDRKTLKVLFKMIRVIVVARLHYMPLVLKMQQVLWAFLAQFHSAGVFMLNCVWNAQLLQIFFTNSKYRTRQLLCCGVAILKLVASSGGAQQQQSPG